MTYSMMGIKMGKNRQSNIHGVVSDLRLESYFYFRQWVLWLGLGSAGGAVAFISLAAALPDPDYAFRIFLFSLWSFLIGVLSAGICMLLASLRAKHAESHFATAYNRNELSDAAKSIPELISSPRSIADEYNKPRDHLLAGAEKADRIAERAWKWRTVFNRVIIFCQIVSGLSFVLGVAWPLVFVSYGGSLVSS